MGFVVVTPGDVTKHPMCLYCNEMRYDFIYNCSTPNIMFTVVSIISILLSYVFPPMEFHDNAIAVMPVKYFHGLCC